MQQASQKIGYTEISERCGVPVTRVKYHHKQLEKDLQQTSGKKRPGGRYEFSLSEQAMLISRVQDCAKKAGTDRTIPQKKRSSIKFSATRQRDAFNQRACLPKSAPSWLAVE